MSEKPMCPYCREPIGTGVGRVTFRWGTMPAVEWHYECWAAVYGPIKRDWTVK